VAVLPRGTARRLRIALTPLHGVGGAVAVHALRRAVRFRVGGINSTIRFLIH